MTLVIYQGTAQADETMWSVAAVVEDWAQQEPVHVVCMQCKKKKNIIHYKHVCCRNTIISFSH